MIRTVEDLTQIGDQNKEDIKMLSRGEEEFRVKNFLYPENYRSENDPFFYKLLFTFIVFLLNSLIQE